VPDQCLDLGGVGSALAEPGGESMPGAVGAQAGMLASLPAASTTWVMPETVSGPRCPVQIGPG